MKNEIYTKIANETAEGYDQANIDNRFNNADSLKSVLNDLTLANYKEFLSYLFYHWLPDYFFVTPASSTGKYHPAFANRTNGLVLHSVATVKFAKHLTELDPDIDDITYNNIILAAFAHDMFKYGDPAEPGKYTKHGHPQYAADFFKNDAVIAKASEFDISSESMQFISEIIVSHMGPWTTNKYDPIVLEAPKTHYQMLLHKADLFASFKEGAVVSDLL